MLALLVILTLLAPSFFAQKIDCSVEESCFGEPYNCDPNSSCQTLFYFGPDGSLHLFLRNLMTLNGYAAFAVQPHPDEIIEYFMCVPRHGHRIRAFAELEGLVLIAEKNLPGAINRLGDNYFRCIFNVSEIPKQFKNEQIFFVTRGEYNEEVMLIVDGAQLFDLKLYADDDEEYDEEEEEVVPVAHHIGSPVHHRATEDESESLQNLPPTLSSQDEEEFESMGRTPRHLPPRKSDSADLDKDYEETLRKHYIQKNETMEGSPPPKANETDHQDDDYYLDDEEDFEEADERGYRIQKIGNIPRRRRDNSESRHRETFKKFVESSRNQKEAYDNSNNFDATKKLQLMFIVALFYLQL